MVEFALSWIYNIIDKLFLFDLYQSPKQLPQLKVHPKYTPSSA